MSDASTAKPDNDDWRITKGSELFRGATFAWKQWYEFREGWDHDHCQFCWVEFAEPHPDEPERLQAGYTTAGPVGLPASERCDDYHWVCEPCFEDFRERFEWKVR